MFWLHVRRAEILGDSSGESGDDGDDDEDDEEEAEQAKQGLLFDFDI